MCNAAFEPGSFVVLCAGAMRVTDAKNDCAEVAEDCIAFLDLTWHPNHGDGPKPHFDAFVTVPVVEKAPAGQFDLYFCSTRCLRAFFGACVDELEARMEARRTKPKAATMPGTRTKSK